MIVLANPLAQVSHPPSVPCILLVLLHVQCMVVLLMAPHVEVTCSTKVTMCYAWPMHRMKQMNSTWEKWPTWCTLSLEPMAPRSSPSLTNSYPLLQGC